MFTETLPCGYVDPESGVVIREIELDEMTGYEEDILGDKAKHKTGRALDEVLARCLHRLGDRERKDPQNGQRGLTFVEDVRNMLASDRTFLLIRLRQLSMGSTFAFPAVCLICNCRMERVEVELEGLSITTMKEEDVIRGEWDVELPSGRTATFRSLTGKDERTLQQIQKAKKDSLFSAVLNLRVTQLDGEKSSIKALKGLTKRDRDFLRARFDEKEGGIDTDIEIDCEECGQEFVMTLPVGEQSFFFPSGMRA